MKESWEKGDFWVCCASNKSWAFDVIHWANIDHRFFGPGDLEDLLEFLTLEERAEIAGFVQRIFREKDERVLEN